MTTLYVTEPGCQVHKTAERLVVTKDQKILEEIPLIKVDQVVMMGKGVSLTTSAMFALAGRGAEVVYLTGSGRYVSRVIGSEHKHSRLRYQQALAVSNPSFALPVIRSVVAGKIANQRTLAMRHVEGAAFARAALDGMDAMARRVDAAQSPDELRGLEGQAAKEYFSLLRRLLKPPAGGTGWNFERRAYYPSPDPINALLSFGYTLLLKDLEAACQLIGLDPYLGFFHVIDYGRPSMALDLEEEFRPLIVDSIVLYLVNRSLIRPSDFESGPEPDESSEQPAPSAQKPAGGVYLKPEARGRFLAAYESRINEQMLHSAVNERLPYRQIFRLQAALMARFILGEAKQYTPMMVR